LAAVVAEVPKAERRFGRYTLLYRIATGGMANLYLGHYAGPDGFEKFVAIKRIHAHLAENPEFSRMFVDEARLAARISHPNVVQVLELGAVNGAYFICMEYVDGESLVALLRRTRVPIDIGVRIVSQAAQGLHAAHELRNHDGTHLNVVHRDVSPSNLLISYDGVVKVVDFGVAKCKGNTATTGVGTVKGKFAYIAPEQLAAGAAPVDRRADIFALGIVLYEVTTWRRLFYAETEAQTADLVLRHPIPRPGLVVKDYPGELESILMRALERDPQRRYQTAHELHLDLEHFLAGRQVLPSTIGDLMRESFPDSLLEKEEMMRRCREVIDSTPAPGPYELSGASSYGPLRRWALIGGLAAAVLGLLVAGALTLFRSHRVSPTMASRLAVAGGDGLVQVQIRTEPAGAEILVDGKLVPNPLDTRWKRREGKVTVVVKAAGYHSREFEIPLAEGGRWFIALERRAPPTGLAVVRPPGNGEPRPGKRRPGKAVRKGPRGTQGDTVKNLFKNPYER
jgi:serine/threonine-protein kinase